MNQYQPKNYELTAIKKNDRSYFDNKYTEYNNQEKEGFLRASIYGGYLPMIEYFMEKDVKIVNNVCLDSLAERANQVKSFKYLESQGVDLTLRGHMPLYRAIGANRLKNVEYLLEKVPDMDFRTVSMGINQIIDKTDNQKTAIAKYEEVLNLLLKKVTLAGLKSKVLDNERRNSPEKNSYIFQLFLKLNLSDDTQSKKSRIKI